MSNRNPRFLFVSSTSGSVMDRALSSGTVRDVTHSLVTDRACEAVQKAGLHGVRSEIFDEGSNERFCDRLLKYLIANEIDYVLSFYTKFYTDELRTAYKDRIINFHPSLLPAFKGMDGFGDGVRYHTKIIGTTVELIKDVMDEGKIVMQTSCAVDPNLDPAALRHRVFEQQCKTLVQVVNWIVEERLSVRGDLVVIKGASYHDLEFVPALDSPEAINMQIPTP